METAIINFTPIRIRNSSGLKSSSIKSSGIYSSSRDSILSRHEFVSESHRQLSNNLHS